MLLQESLDGKPSYERSFFRSLNAQQVGGLNARRSKAE